MVCTLSRISISACIFSISCLIFLGFVTLLCLLLEVLEVLQHVA